MKIEEYDHRRHFGHPSAGTRDYDLVIKSNAADRVLLTEGDAYQLVYDILEYLDENEP